MSIGIVLVHGYTGSPENLGLLAQRLADLYGNSQVTIVHLPGYGVKDAPPFDNDAFTECISAAVKPYLKEKRKIIILGYSTGGVLTLSFILKKSFTPHLLILASVPKSIDVSYIERWNKHRTGKKVVPFSSVAKMVSLINSVGSQRFNRGFPILIVHGENDSLVPPQEPLAWMQNSFVGPVRSIIIPSAEHNIFIGTNSKSAIDVVVRAISDIAIPLEKQDRKIIKTLSIVEYEVKKFLAVSPLSKRHLSQCPSGQIVVGNKPLLSSIVKNEPVLANIEITTRCNLECRYCARTIYGKRPMDMSKEMFMSILDILPHAYRITLVGLGEPLLHPDVVDFVAGAFSRGRRVVIVTNAMCLDKSLSHELIRAGLQSIAFSIDAPDQETASHLRYGTDLERVLSNIKGFTKIVASKRAFSTAVFSTVSVNNVEYLESLIDTVSQLGVKVLMLTDLNFKSNIKDTLWQNSNVRVSNAVRSTVKLAFSKKLPVLSVHGLEEFGLARRYKDFLLLPPSRLYRRSSKRTWCFSPWQTLPVDVHGNVTVCDCQPENAVGNLFTTPFSKIWNGRAMIEHRKRMLSLNPPAECKICPRF